jgi:hypothetical protein
MPNLISDTVSAPRCSPAVFGLKIKQFQPVDPDPSLYLTGKTERGPRRIRNGSQAAAQPRADKLLAGREFASLEDTDENGRPGRYRRIGMAPEEMS